MVGCDGCGASPASSAVDAKLPRPSENSDVDKAMRRLDEMIEWQEKLVGALGEPRALHDLYGAIHVSRLNLVFEGTSQVVDRML